MRVPGSSSWPTLYLPWLAATIDGHPAAIVRVNRLMRGALVAAGDHRLVYVYKPWSFRIGLITTSAGLAIAGLFWLRGLRA